MNQTEVSWGSFVTIGFQNIIQEIYGYWLTRLGSSDPAVAKEAWEDLKLRDARCISMRSEIFTHLRGKYPRFTEWVAPKLNFHARQ